MGKRNKVNRDVSNNNIYNDIIILLGNFIEIIFRIN